jgi:predicted DNA-binding protein YlxM (UPF0122 family)
MADSRIQPDFESCPLRQLVEILRQALPSLEGLIETCRGLLQNSKGDDKGSACDLCPDKETYTESYGNMQKTPLKVNRGRGRRENLTGFYESTLDGIRETRYMDVFHQYEECKDIFSDKQWLAIYLRHHDGKKIKEIAEILKITKGSVGDRLSNAEKKKEQHYRNIRLEKLEYLRKKMKEDNP